MPEVGQLHHVVLEVADLVRAEAFYGDLLGMRAVGRDLWPESGPNAAFVAESGQYFVLVQVPQVKTDAPVMHTQLYLSPEAWHAVCDRLRESGYDLNDDRMAGQRAAGELGINVCDPDGHALELNAHEPRAYEMPPARRGKIVAGAIEDFPIGSVTRIPSAKCYLVRLADGVLALSQICTHMQFPVVYQPENYRFYCPRHRRRFTWTGTFIPREFEDDTPPLHCYAIEFVDGQVVVDTDVSLPRDPDTASQMVPVPPER